MLSNQERIKLMREKLTASLQPNALEVIDDSARHKGHAGASTGLGHFIVNISSNKFEGKSVLQQHRMVYKTLGSMMETDIHALNISSEL